MDKPREFNGQFYRKLPALKDWTNRLTEPVLEPELEIIDPHHHLWDDHRGQYLIREFLEDVGSGHNVLATVYVDAGSMYRSNGPAPMRPVGEVEFVNGMAAMSASGNYGTTRLCAGIVGHADLSQGNDVKPVLEALMAAGNGRLRGIRHGVTWDSGNAASFSIRRAPQHQMLDSSFRKGLAHVHSLGLSFDAWLFYAQLPDLIDLLREFPDMNVILNHSGGILGIPPHDGNRQEVFNIWKRHILELARFPNLSVKIGGLGMLYCGWDFHFRDTPPSSEELASTWKPYVDTCIEAFGPSRCMMESNFPVDKQSCGYRVLWNTLKRITHAHSAAEKAALYKETAARVYRLAI